MAGTLTVQNIQGPASGANANKIIIPSGQTLDASAGGMKTPAGHVIQVVGLSGNTQSQVATESITRVSDTVSITPSSSSNKILVIACATVRFPHGDAGFTALHRQIYGGSWSEIKQFSRHTMYRNFDTASISGQFIQFSFLDSPGTTSAVTYSWAMNRFGSGTAYINPNPSSGDSINWTLMEIAG